MLTTAGILVGKLVVVAVGVMVGVAVGVICISEKRCISAKRISVPGYI